MTEMQKIINAERSDLFDVLAHVAYALPPVTREKRANQAKIAIQSTFNNRQQAFSRFRTLALCKRRRAGARP